MAMNPSANFLMYARMRDPPRWSTIELLDLIAFSIVDQRGGSRMRAYIRKLALGFIAMSFVLCQARAQQAPADAKQTDSSTIAPDGTAYVTRLGPIPTTISPAAQQGL